MFVGNLLKMFQHPNSESLTRENKSGQFICSKLESLNLPDLTLKKIKIFTDLKVP